MTDQDVPARWRRLMDTNQLLRDERDELQRRLAESQLDVLERGKEIDRLRERIHTVVDETQRRYAEYQARCDKFDAWTEWTRRFLAEHNTPQGLGMLSLAHRDLLMLLLQDRERAEASRQAWAEEAAHTNERINIMLGLLDCVHDSDPCWFDHHGGCQAHGFLSLEPGEVCPQKEIADLLAAEEAKAMDSLKPREVCACATREQLAALDPKLSPPQCSAHPEPAGLQDLGTFGPNDSPCDVAHAGHCPDYCVTDRQGVLPEGGAQ